MNLAPKHFYKVAYGANASEATIEPFEDEWDAHARYAVLVDSLHYRHDKTPGEKKAWEHMAQGGSQNWNARSIIDGKEENVWLWRTNRQ